MESSNFKIEKLRGKDNWLQWRFVIRTLLEEDDDMVNVCEGILTRPVAGSNNHDTLVKKFLKADKAARKLIVTTVERKPLDLLLCCSTASEMWKKLNTVYDMKSDENLSMVQKQFFDSKWEESESVAHNLSKIEQLATKMKSLGSEVPESMLVTRILSILPRKFNHFHSAWDSVEDNRRNLENLTTRLMAEELRVQNNDTQELNVALAAKAKITNNYSRKEGRKSTQGDEEERNRVFNCYNCGRIGHKRKDCFGCYTCGSKSHISKNCFRNKGRRNFQDGGTSSWQQKSNSENNGGQRRGNRVAYVGTSDVSDNDFWLIDSGASDHMTNRREWFCDFEEFTSPVDIKIGNGDSMYAYGKGNIEIDTFLEGGWKAGIMHDVLFVPNLKQNLFAVKVVAKKGIDFSITNNGKQCLFIRDKEIVATGSDIGNLYKINLRVIIQRDCNLSNSASLKNNEDKLDTLQLWHERLCHQNYKHVKNFLKNININFKDDNIFCEGCAYGKQHRLSFHDNANRATRVREVIHADVCGPMEQESLGRKRYFVLFKDVFSRYRKIYFIREKTEVAEKLKLFCSEIENQFNENIKAIHSDNGGEFKNRHIEIFLNNKGIKHSLNVPYTPEQNGIAERENRTICEAARSMIYSKPDLPLFLWAEAMNTAVNVLNRTGPTKQAGKTPYELWYGKVASIDDLKIFGTECFVHIPVEKRRKLDKKAVKGYLVGYIENCKGYRVYVPSLRDVILSRDVVFKPEMLVPNEVSINVSKDNRKTNKENLSFLNNDDALEVEGFYEIAQNEKENESEPEEPLQSSDNQSGRELRDRYTIKPTDFYGCPITYLAEVLPLTYNEAINSDNKKYWKEAMQDEIHFLHENKTWKLVDKPENEKVISSRWVYTKKLKPDNTERYKARLVIKGYSQK